MTKTNDDIVTITALTSGITVPGAPGSRTSEGRALLRGQTVTVARADTLNRFGESWLDQTPEQQIKRWGIQKWMIGTPAESEGITLGDDDVHGFRYRQWVSATEQAKAISDPADRAEALAKVKKDFPEQKTSSQWTLKTY